MTENGGDTPVIIANHLTLTKGRKIMNHKQKLGYMAIGAGIMAIGIIIGQVITPDIEAQNNGVFDQIECREIVVRNPDGNRAIRLSSKGGGSIIELFDDTGKVTVSIFQDNNRDQAAVIVGNRKAVRSVGLKATKDTARFTVWNDNNEAMISLSGSATWGNRLSIYDANGDTGVDLSVSPGSGNSITIESPEGDSKASINLSSHGQSQPSMQIYNSRGHTVWSTWRD